MVFKKGNQYGKGNIGRKRADASIRMKENNPMSDIKNIEKMKNTISKKIEEGWIHEGRFKRGMIGTNTNKKFTEEHKRNIGKSNSGKIRTMEMRENISKSRPKSLNMTPESTKSKSDKMKKWHKNVGLSKESIQRLREIRQKQVLEYGGPMSIGKHEKQILDELAKKIGYNILRQHPVLGYWLDGYIPKLNLAIEIDEKHHKNQIEKDKEREEIIKKELNCSFIRIPLYN